MTRNKMMLALVLMVAMIVTAACGGANSNTKSDANNNAAATDAPKDPVTIEFWTMQLSPTFDDYIKNVISNFEKENADIKVKWVDIPWGDMEKKILASVASKTAPDVANLNPQFASKLAELDALVNMDEMVDKATIDTYFEGVWKSNTFNGKTFGIPWYLSSEITMYNTDIFKAAGLDPEKAPATYEELAQVAKTIKEKTGKYAWFPNMDGSKVLEGMVSDGIQLTDADMKKSAFNTPEAVAFFQYYTDLYKQDLIPREVVTEGHSKAIDMYQAGSLAILASGPQFLNKVQENAPDVLKATKSAPSVAGKTGKKNVAAMNLVVPKQSKHQEAAVKFSVYMTNAENQVTFDKIVPILPSIETALEDPYFNTLPESPTPIDRARIVSAAQLKDSEVLVPPMKNYDEIKKAIVEELQAAMLGKKSAEDAVKQAAARVDAELAK
ncbi:ABC transporter substrate-binding protein [Paenibacillus sp. GCM10023252]|uniref:ABC transporter substrate-binding protein n=1 Tax=Paenibacillus sp. GCM10023252 TaxID=3252649 RepID=UPI00360C992B